MIQALYRKHIPLLESLIKMAFTPQQKDVISSFT